MNQNSIHVEHKSLGDIYITEENNKICAVDFKPPKNIMLHESELLQNAKKQLLEYLNHQRQSFDLPLQLIGTDFQCRAWEALLNIPYGTTWSYKQQAKTLQKEKAVRAVGSANGKNPIPIIIPCHRVIGENGALTGYSGGLDKKVFLLKHEGVLLG